jgi:hypothetical protein
VISQANVCMRRPDLCAPHSNGWLAAAAAAQWAAAEVALQAQVGGCTSVLDGVQASVDGFASMSAELATAADKLGQPES